MNINNRETKFGEFLKGLRKNKKLTLSNLAELTGISPSYLSRIERAERNIPNALILKKLASPLGLSPQEMMIAAGYLTRDLENISSDKYKNEAPSYWQEILKDPSLDAALKEIGHLTSDEKEGLLVYLKAIKLHRDTGKSTAKD